MSLAQVPQVWGVEMPQIWPPLHSALVSWQLPATQMLPWQIVVVP